MIRAILLQLRTLKIGVIGYKAAKTFITVPDVRPVPAAKPKRIERSDEFRRPVSPKRVCQVIETSSYRTLMFRRDMNLLLRLELAGLLEDIDNILSIGEECAGFL